MTEKELVIQHQKDEMVKAFLRGDILDAQNRECFVRTLEKMSDEEFYEIVAEECGVIS